MVSRLSISLALGSTNTHTLLISFMPGTPVRALNNIYTATLSSPVIKLIKISCLRISLSVQSTFKTMLTYLKDGMYQEILLYRSFGFNNATYVNVTVTEVVADDQSFVIKFNFIIQFSGSIASVDYVQLVDGSCRNPGEPYE